MSEPAIQDDDDLNQPRADRKYVAYHEAGHAVICLRLGYEVRSVTIKGDKRAEGRTNIKKKGGPVLDHIRIDLAGPVAQALIDSTPFNERVRFGSRGDWHHICKIAREVAMLSRAFNGTTEPDLVIEILHSETKALVQWNKQAIARVAEALLKHETLTGNEVKQLIES